MNKNLYQTPKGQRTREGILSLAVDIASAEGLEGLTIGHLAEALRMSKSGLFAHFGSKEELQLATVDRAGEVFGQKVLEPLGKADAGLPKLLQMMSTWIRYVESGTFRGGCFFAAASAEFDGRPGAVRDRIAALTKEWIDLIEGEVARARDLGHLDPKTDAAQLAFELHAYTQEANWAYQLLGDPESFDRARRGVEDRLRGLATQEGLRVGKVRRVAKASDANLIESV